MLRLVAALLLLGVANAARCELVSPLCFDFDASPESSLEAELAERAQIAARGFPESLIRAEAAGPVALSASGEGLDGRALVCLPGAGPHLRLPGAALWPRQGFIMMWVRTSLDRLPARPVDLLRVGGQSSAEGSLVLEVAFGSPRRLQLFNGPVANAAANVVSAELSAPLWHDGEWNHIAIQWRLTEGVPQDSMLALFVNGRGGRDLPPRRPLSRVTPWPASAAVQIGDGLEGAIDDLLILPVGTARFPQMNFPWTGESTDALLRAWRLLPLGALTGELGIELSRHMSSEEFAGTLVPLLHRQADPAMLSQLGSDELRWHGNALAANLGRLRVDHPRVASALASRALQASTDDSAFRQPLESLLVQADAIASHASLGFHDATEDHRIGHLAFTPDNRHVLTLTLYGSAALWEISTGQQVWHVEGIARSEPRLVMSPNGRLAACLGLGERWQPIERWDTTVLDVTTGTILCQLDVFDLGQPADAAFDPDDSGAWLASSHGAEGVTHLTIPQGQIDQRWGPSPSAGALCLLPGGGSLLVSDWQHAISRIDLGSGAVTSLLASESMMGEDLVPLPGGQRVVFADRFAARLIDCPTGSVLRLFDLRPHSVEVFAISPEPGLLLAIGSQTSAPVWRLDTGEVWCSLLIPVEPLVTAAALSPDGALAALGDTRGTVRLFRIPPLRTD